MPAVSLVNDGLPTLTIISALLGAIFGMLAVNLFLIISRLNTHAERTGR